MKHKIADFKQYINAICSAEGLFFTGFIIYLCRGMWETTMLPLNTSISQLCLLLTIFFITMKILFFDTYSVGGYLGMAAGVGCTILIYLNSGYTNPFFWLLLLVGCRNIPFEKILKVYLVIIGSIMILAFCAAFFGVIENLVYKTSGRGVRIAFGSIYVTDFASHIFYMILTYCYLKADQLKTYHFVGILIIAGVVYHFCKTRLDCLSMVLVVVVFGINHWLQKLSYNGKGLLKKWRYFWRRFGMVSMPLFALISFVCTKYYNEENKVLKLVNKVISNRLSLGKQGLDTYPVTLWGQVVDMVGAGGSDQWPTDYFFIDNSYIHILLRFGFVFVGALLVVYVLCCYRHKGDIYFLFAVALIAINCVIAHHILDATYNPLVNIFLAYCVKGEKKLVSGPKVM
ncbi:hypothetical protein SAMN05443270_1965 [Lacrimispora sphenoides]|jgi:hypothetical protein|uniref:hypothetical protein n=1 Tax=Lacrimispora sphenoides TaxID=29370 RepID=UPI0008CA11BF|nr:hypothetical protein [Lacrimispora sphenoides]SET90538.1 hypothetical protein SAMN05443270_1965 [Lacrimispora sphenoides]